MTASRSFSASPGGQRWCTSMILSCLVWLVLSAFPHAARILGQESAKPGASDEDDRDPAAPWNLATPTMGGRQFWTDEMIYGEWRIQRNVVTGHYRLLDDRNQRLAWGSYEACRHKFQAAREDRQLPRLEGPAVILLHGLGRTRHAMDSLGTALQKAGYTVFNMSYASTREGIAEHAKSLARVIDQIEGCTEINFVCHSLGNLVVRHYLADQADAPANPNRPPVHRFVMLGPPNNGADFARRLKDNHLFEILTGKSGQSLGGGWDELVQHLATPPCEFGIIAGNRGPANPLLRGDDDLVVTIDETRLPGACDFIVVPTTHSGMLLDPASQKCVVRFLQDGFFRENGTRRPIGE